MRALLLAACLAWPGGLVAQDWATRTFCDAGARPVEAVDFAPHDLLALESRAAEIPNGLGRFWRVESPGGAISHLWGTFHVSHPDILDLPDLVRTTIAASDTVVLEVDFTHADRESFLTQYDLPGRYRDPGDPFAGQDMLDLSFLGAEAEGWVLDRLYGYGTGEDALYVLTYAGLAELLLSDPCEDFSAGTIPVQDDYIQTLGRIAGAKIVGLETPGEFLTDLAGKDDTAQAIVTVYASYLQPQSTPVARIAAFQLYREGRLGLLAALDHAHMQVLFGDGGIAALERTDGYLLEQRNTRFLERSAALLQEGGVFMAVGAAHLPGPNGLVALLEDKGYSVTRVVLPGEVE